jgi:hypothetical protein
VFVITGQKQTSMIEIDRLPLQWLASNAWTGTQVTLTHTLSVSTSRPKRKGTHEIRDSYLFKT